MRGFSVPLSSFTPAQRLYDIIQKDFGFPIKERLHIAPNVAMYNLRDDVSVFTQSMTGKYEYEVYFDGEFVCYFNIMDHPQRARIKVLKGLSRLFSEEKIHWNLNKYEEIRREKKQKEIREKEERDKKRPKFKTKEQKKVEYSIRKAVGLK